MSGWMSGVRELEILAVEIGQPETYLLVVHVMPTTLRGGI